MDTSIHNIPALFAQLGLDNGKSNIEDFINTNKIDKGVSIENASFWTESQASFISESLKEDADWCEVIDQLDNLLR